MIIPKRALAATGALALVNAGLLVAQAFLLAGALAQLVHNGHPGNLALLAATVVGRAGITWATKVVSARAAAGAKEELRAKAVDRALRLGPEWIQRHGTAELTTLTTKGLDALDAYFTTYLPSLVTAAVVPLGAGAAVLFADWPSAVILVVTVPLLPMFAILVGKYTADRVPKATDAAHALSATLLELVRALPVLAAFRRAEAQAETVRRVSERHRRATVQTLKTAFASAFVLELAATLSVAVVAVVIGVRLVSGDLSLAIGLGVLILVPECYQPLRSVGAAFHASEDGVEAVRRVTEILDEPAPGEGTAKPSKGLVRVDDLRVGEREGESFTVRPGEIAWLRAPSGAGKSTTFAALLGFVQPTDGTITVDGRALADFDRVAWRENVAWVPQSPRFTGGTVRGELELAGEFTDVPLGLDGFLDRQVSELSIGERQRVAVARALVRVRNGAWLLLLDEPTAHLDAGHTAEVMIAVEAAADAGAAVVIAAHDRTKPVEVPPGAAPPHRHQTGKLAKPSLRELIDGHLLGGAALGSLALLAGIALTATSAWLIAKASLQPPMLTLTVAIVGVRAFGLGRATLRYWERLVTHDAAFRIAGRLRVRTWLKLSRIDTAEGRQRLVDDVDTVRDLLPRTLTPPLIAALVVAGAVAVQTAILPAAGLVLAIAALIGGLAAPALALKLERNSTSALAAGRRLVTTRLLGLFESSAELMAFGADRRRRRELAEADARLAADARRQAFGAGAAEALIALAMGAAAVVCTFIAAPGVEAPILALVPLALAEVLVTLPPVAQHWDELRQAHARLEIPAETPLEPMEIELPHGKYVAVVGPSGAGKSTLLARLAVTHRVAWAPQEPQLVATTVAENLRLGDPMATDEQLREALDLAVLPDVALERRLGSGGTGLSGGEAQRVALARALLAAPDAEVVLLDEPTAHLDEPTARKLRANLRRALDGRTVIQVTHHADEADDADLIWEVQGGRIL
ncbi:thiol reductant ABC exporter subunit CydD [Amycolatopsis sp. NPDC059657]|uniref:thiol reductant ABC exporter subunit CydD n=1 Tax=Amycolatopsis sp. NPDC059657 TaxID=3346899 RepID=UPI00366BCE20